jgi:hypothetical protein
VVGGGARACACVVGWWGGWVGGWGELLALGRRAAGTWAAPLCFWQSRQWQRRVKTGSPAAS